MTTRRRPPSIGGSATFFIPADHLRHQRATFFTSTSSNLIHRRSKLPGLDAESYSLQLQVMRLTTAPLHGVSKPQARGCHFRITRALPLASRAVLWAWLLGRNPRPLDPWDWCFESDFPSQIWHVHGMGATACGAGKGGNRSVDSSFEDSGCVVRCEHILLADGRGSCNVAYIVTEYPD